MSEVTERARGLTEKYVGSTCMEHCWCQYSEKNGDDYVSCEDKLIALIEQALLAERRLAMEEAAEIADKVGRGESGGDYPTARTIAIGIRAAAEKEVSPNGESGLNSEIAPRGGE